MCRRAQWILRAARRRREQRQAGAVHAFRLGREPLPPRGLFDHRARRCQEREQLVQAPQPEERRMNRRTVFRRLAPVRGRECTRRALSGAQAVVAGATVEAGGGPVRMDAAAKARLQVAAGLVRRLVVAEALVRIEGWRHAAQAATGGAIGVQVPESDVRHDVRWIVAFARWRRYPRVEP